MKQEIAAFELKYIIDELKKEIIGSKVDKIFQPDKKEIIFQLYKTNAGKKLLRILPGKFLYLTEYKGESPQNPFGYCLFLRKHLDGSRIADIRQVGFERIVEITFERKDLVYKFIAEFYDKGNIITCDKNYKIISPLEIQKWEKRTIMAGKDYSYPEKKYDFFELSKEDLKKFIADADQDSIVKSLASGLGLGGVYAEEICLLSQIDKTISPKKVDLNKLYAGIKALRDSKPHTLIIKNKDDTKDIIPIRLERYKDFESIPVDSYNKAFDMIFTDVKITLETAKVNKEHTTAFTKTEKLLEVQKKQLAAIERDYLENQKLGEAVFENYVLIKDILDQIKDARKKLSFAEIKKKLEGHKIIKDIDEKNSTVEIEL